MDETHARRNASSTQRRAAELFALIADATGFLGRTAWPIADLLIRLWIGKQAIVSGLLLANDWNTALTLAVNEYPIPWLDPTSEALLGIILQLLGGISLVLGLGTRFGALAIVVLNLATQVYYVALDLDLFRVALAAAYLFRGPGPFSLDVSARPSCGPLIALGSPAVGHRALCGSGAVSGLPPLPRISHPAQRDCGAMCGGLQRNDRWGRHFLCFLDTGDGAVARLWSGRLVP